jgi:hypothetical protein
LTAVGPRPVTHAGFSKTQQQAEVPYHLQLSSVTRVTLPLLSETSPLILGHQQLSSKVRNVSFLTVGPLLPRWHRTLRTPVTLLQNPLIYHPIVSPGLKGVGALRNWRVYSSMTSDILHSSVHIDPPVSSLFSSNSVGSVNQTFYSSLDVLLMGDHDILLSNITVTLNPLEHISSLDNAAVLFLLNTLLLLFLVTSCPVLPHQVSFLRDYPVSRLLPIVPELNVLFSNHLPGFLTVQKDFLVSVPLVPSFLIFYPPPQVGLQAFVSIHAPFHQISRVDKQSHNQNLIRTDPT